MKTDLNIKAIISKVKVSFGSARRYTVFAFILAVVGLYGFLVYQINLASRAEPTQTDIATQQSSLKRLKIDQQSIDKIQQLEDQNVGVKSLFKAARDNPFQEE